MFTTQKMVLLDVLVLQKDIENVSKLIVEAGYFEPSSHSSIDINQEHLWTHENIGDKKKILSTFYKETLDLQAFFNAGSILTSQPSKQVLTIPAIGEKIRQYTLKRQQLEERANRIRKQKEDIAIKMAGLRMYQKTQKQKTQNLKSSEDLYSILGLITVPNLSILKSEIQRLNGEFLTEGHVNEFEIIFITVHKNQKADLQATLDQLYFINYGLPDEFFGEGISNMMNLGLEFTMICDQEDMLETEIQKLRPAVLSNLNDIASSLNLYSKMSEVRQNIRQAGHFVLLSGWIAAENFRKFKKDLEQLCGNNYELTVTDTDTFKVASDIPTKLHNPKFLSPFEQLVTTFGTPNYKEIDPTIFFSILYVIMYGAMFGDVGQGALMLLLGVYGHFFMKKSSFSLIFNLMIWVGTSSTIFGLLYGSYFGYESAYYDWVPAPLWISPMHNINTILLYAILFGIGVISFSYILGITNAIRMKDMQALFFSHKGLTAFIVYLIILGIVYCFVYQIPTPIVLYITLILLSLFLGLERVWDAIIFGHGSIKDYWMGAFDMFEFFLSMLTNTLSFVRIGAFALTHAALMMAIFTLRDLAGGNTWQAYLIIIIGNLFVIGMEGFIVGIQTLRLEYYEFFLRFFRGTGRTFKPITYK